jgi:hypothetical protein
MCWNPHVQVLGEQLLRPTLFCMLGKLVIFTRTIWMLNGARLKNLASG